MTSSSSSPLPTDATLWQSVRQGNSQAFQAVVERYQSLVSAVAYAVVGDFSLSQDVAQETFWSAWKSREALERPQSLGSWLCGIARNVALQAKRKQRFTATTAPLEHDVAARETDPEFQSISAEESAVVWQSLESLPEHYREVLVLYYRQERSVAEVALALELSEDAVKQRLSRGRAMLRDQLAELVEGALVKSRPGRSFTKHVMAGIAGTVAVLKQAGTASAASLAGKATSSALGSLGAVSTGTLTGLLGGLAGAAGGLGGAWLGNWLPAQLAPTLAERRLIERTGRRTLLAGLAFTLLILILAGVVFLTQAWLWYLAGLVGAMVVFGVYITIEAIRLNGQIRELRAAAGTESEPNPTKLRAYFMSAAAAERPRYRGRTYTSGWRLLGLPLCDIQVRDPMLPGPAGPKGPDEPKTARGWIAIGDRADGILLAIGGRARGLVALGGLAFGVVALGGLSLGLVSLGGLALGGLALGGGAIGHTAVGGMALGWQAAGGGALGWHSAAGGAALARHAAFGGLAVSSDFAVGGQAIAREANTELARQVVAAESLKWMLDGYIAHQALSLVVIIVLSIAPLLLLPLLYRRDSDGAA